MKNSWTTTIAAAAVIGLLTLFLGLQYNWQSQASAAERDRLQKRVESDTKNFADDFNREIQGAFFNFQIDPELISKGDAAELAERFEFWKQNTQFPNMIDEIVFLPSGGEGAAQRFDPEAKMFVDVRPEPKLAAVIEKITTERRPPPFIEDQFALLVPLHSPEKGAERVMVRRAPADERQPIVEFPAPVGYIAVFLKESVIRDEMLPAFAARHFQSNEYGLAVFERGGNAVFKTADISAAPDAAAPLFDLAPDNLIFFARREMVRSKNVDQPPNIVVDQHIESRAHGEEIKTSSEKSETFTVRMEEGSRKRTAVIAGESGAGSPWTLSVQHSAGSIDAYVTGARTRSFLIGVGIYALLVGSILAIVYSSMRVRRYAQRQIDFVSSVSHEFRTPLAVIYSAGENLADGVATEEDRVSRYGDLIKGEGKKLSAMVEQILEFAGARGGKRKYNLIEADISTVVRNAIKDCEPALEEAGFSVESNFAENLPKVSIDTEAIRGAVRNLIHNGVKYSNGSRWLRVSAENGNGTIKIIVEDRGIGISTADRKKIFEPFYRAKGAVDAQIHGNGLGLSLVKETARAHGGSVRVTSEVGTGSTFTIEIPQI